MKVWNAWAAVAALSCMVAAAPPGPASTRTPGPAPASKPAAKAAAKPPAQPEAQAGEALHAQLDTELSETGGSPTDIVAILEKHLQTHAGCDKRDEMVRVLAQLAVQLEDRRRVLAYGPAVLDRGVEDAKLMSAVTTALLARNEPGDAARARVYATQFAAYARLQRQRLLDAATYSPGQGQQLEKAEETLGHALALCSRAHRANGEAAAALAAADEGWGVVLTVELALERAEDLRALGRYADALAAASDAFVVVDGGASDKDRQRARDLLAALAPEAHLDPAAGLLAAWDRSRIAIAARGARLRQYDPNSSATSPLDFTLTRLEGDRLALSSLKGKVVVFDFWATWCGPCRAQHPLYEQVKQRFRGNQDVVFLAVATDEDRTLIKPFLDKQQWSREVLFDDGLGSYFRVRSIPTTIVLNRRGEIASRMPGFIADRFVDMLTERIQAALADN